jgi:cell division protein FtsW
MSKPAFKVEVRHLDPMLVGAVVCLAVIGTVMVASASISLADRDAGEPFFYLLRHLGALGLGLIGMLFVAAVPTEVWFRLHWLALLVCIAVLVLVLMPSLGDTVNGSTRWLTLGPIGFQASEPARLCLLVYLSSYAVRHYRDLASSFMGFTKPMLVVAGVCMLLLAEPDYGATVVVTVASLGVLFVAGARLRDFSVVACAAMGILALLATTTAYRMQRLTAFLDPWQDPFASGFQLTQSLIAIGRGQWWGVGLGESVQKLFYLPEAHTDFVFAVLAEELGFAGSTLIIVLFCLLIYRAIDMGQAALKAGMPFQGLLSTGIGLMLGIEAMINIGVNTGLLPTKGLALPLLSYGRSSTVVTLVALGLLMRIYYELRVVEKQPLKRGRAK